MIRILKGQWSSNACGRLPKQTTPQPKHLAPAEGFICHFAKTSKRIGERVRARVYLPKVLNSSNAKHKQFSTLTNVNAYLVAPELVVIFISDTVILNDKKDIKTINNPIYKCQYRFIKYRVAP